MNKRKLGYTGIAVSPIGLGCMGMTQGFGDAADTKEMVKLLRDAVDLGVNLFDTAEAYGPHTNEELLGDAFEGMRDKVLLATKCGMLLGENGKYYFDGSPKAVRNSLEGSLKRLRTDFIDLYYLHRVDPNTPIEETAACMKELMQEGKIGQWGLSEVDADTIRRAHAVCPLAAVESEYNMMWRVVEKEVLPTCKELGIALVPFSPLAKGFMSGTLNKETTFAKNDSRSRYSRFKPEVMEANQVLIDLVHSYTEKYNATDAQISLAWLMAQYEYLIPIPGTRKFSRVKENLAAADIKMSDGDIAELTKALNSIQIAGERF